MLMIAMAGAAIAGSRCEKYLARRRNQKREDALISRVRDEHDGDEGDGSFFADADDHINLIDDYVKIPEDVCMVCYEYGALPRVCNERNGRCNNMICDKCFLRMDHDGGIFPLRQCLYCRTNALYSSQKALEEHTCKRIPFDNELEGLYKLLLLISR